MTNHSLFRTTQADNDTEASLTTPLLNSSQSNTSSNRNFSSTEQIENEWASHQNKHNPRNWSSTYKWATVALVSFIEFLTTMPNYMYAPNIANTQRDLNTDDDTLATFSLTIYILGFGLGPLLFAPLSELYGRAVIYRACLSMFLLFTVGCAVSGSIGALVAFRFLAGCLGSSPVSIGGAVVGDMFETSERGTAMGVYQAGLIISAVFGPLIGGLIGNYLNWRWVFWIVCIMAAPALISTFVVLRETHAPTLKLSMYGTVDGTDNEDGQKQKLTTKLAMALRRPLKLLTQSPVVFCSCLLIFLVIGLLNVFLSEMGRVFQAEYDMSSGQSGIVYLGLALGFVIAAVLFGSTNDRVMHSLASRNKGEIEAEFRLPATIIAMPTIVVGLLLYGWSLEFQTVWIVPIIGSGVVGIGITTVQLSITTYLIDSFEEFSASALAAITMARSIGGAVIPLVGPFLFKRFGQGWGNSLLAAVSLAFCLIPVVLYNRGARWRTFLSMDDL